MQGYYTVSKFRTKTFEMPKEALKHPDFLFLKGGFNFFDGFSFKRAKLFQPGCQLFIHWRLQCLRSQVKIEFIFRQNCIQSL